MIILPALSDFIQLVQDSIYGVFEWAADLITGIISVFDVDPVPGQIDNLAVPPDAVTRAFRMASDILPLKFMQDTFVVFTLVCFVAFIFDTVFTWLHVGGEG